MDLTFIGSSSLWLDQLLRGINIGDKLALTNMCLIIPIRIGRPDFVIEESTFLAIGMLVGTGRVETRVKLAWDLQMGELAGRDRTIGTIVAQRHRRMLKRAVGIDTVWEESADFFGVMGGLEGWRRVASRAFPVLACRTIRAVVAGVDRGSFRRCR